MSRSTYFPAVDIALTSVLCALWAVLNLIPGPLSFRLLRLPIFHDFAAFFPLLLVTWITGRFGTASLVGIIGSIIVLLVGGPFPNAGFAVPAIFFDILMSANHHKLRVRAYDVVVATLATLGSAYFAGNHWRLPLDSPLDLTTLNTALTFWGGWHLVGGLISIIITLPMGKGKREELRVTGEKEVALLIKEAAKFHGHLGPFLVIGVRMGCFAKRTLNINTVDERKLQVSVKIPLFTPFSCALDGVQVTTNCTIGNRKLIVEKSMKKIVACFGLQGSERTLCISVNPRVVKELVDEISKGVTNEELAARIVSMPERQLFVFEKQ